MKRTSLTTIPIAIVVLAWIAISCASIPGLRDSITVVGLTILQELEVLLTEYESAPAPNDPVAERVLTFEASQMTLYRNCSKLIAQASNEVPAKTLQPYRDRLAAVPRGSPRLP